MTTSMDSENHVLRQLRHVARMRVAVQEHRFDELPAYYTPESSEQVREVEESLTDRLNHLIERYNELTGHQYSLDENSVLEFTWERAPIRKISGLRVKTDG